LPRNVSLAADLASTYVSRALILTLLIAARISAYSVLSHEAIIDAAWVGTIKPLLLTRYAGLNAEALREAHAYAYGGAIIADSGYYPLGSRLFSDLVHYVRGGDFVTALLGEARDVNEFAFAIGALAHYAADDNGHPVAINRIVPMLYPKLRKKYGNIISYEQAPGAHLKTEFGFDVVQVANQHYAPEAYQDFIGFKVSKSVLERAFLKTYGMELKEIFVSVDLALGTFRYSVGGVIPKLTKAAWSAKEDEITKAKPGTTRDKFIYNLSRASYEKEWGDEYERPGVFARILAFIFQLIPKVGPLKAFAFHVPTPEAEKLFMESFNQSLDRYRARLDTLHRGEQLLLPNENLDTGKRSKFGAYKLADKTYAKLLEKLEKRKYDGVDTKLRATVLEYYRGAEPLDRKVAQQLNDLERAALLPAAQTRESSLSSSPGLP
jgi:hypothetical protein